MHNKKKEQIEEYKASVIHFKIFNTLVEDIPYPLRLSEIGTSTFLLFDDEVIATAKILSIYSPHASVKSLRLHIEEYLNQEYLKRMEEA